ncbi:glycosyltransferase family 4 protein [Candidatus Saccharibacteria bacterium]|nr:glycosyltransferase family 4 protein [Candidatus Saccharibacteria bacterium]
MKKKQLNVIFDATVIAFNFQKNSNRSGIFFTAINILDEFLKRADVNVFLYVEPEKYAEELQLNRSFYPEVYYFHDFSSYPKAALAKVTMKLWSLHNKYHKCNIRRKFISLLILINQFIFKQIIKRKPSKHCLKNADVFFSPIYKIPDFVRDYDNIQCCVFLHDAIPLLPIYKINHSKSNKKSHKKLILSFKEHDYFFANSKQTLNDFSKFSSFVNSQTAVVTPLAASEKFRWIADENAIREIKRKYGIDEGKKYIFSLCSLEPRKNMIRSVRSFLKFIEKNNIDDLLWVMGGGTWDSFESELKNEQAQWKKDAVIQIGYVSDEDLPLLYNGAEWFVYTSQYEGFGLPPLEAMQCGCPVITSNNSSLPEVVGDAGITVAWDSDEQHILAYEKYYFNENLRQENSRKGLERAKLFSWKKTVDIIMETLKNKAQEKSTKLNIIYRMCDAVSVSSGNKRCFDVSKNQLIKKCLTSLKSAVENFQGNLRLFCVADNCSNDIIDYVKNNFPMVQLKRFDKIGNAKSFCECIEMAASLPDNEQVLLLEDDYLFLNKNTLELLNFNLDKLSVENDEHVAIMPDDYPDRYKDNAIRTECHITETGHFLKVNKTTCTFATYTDVIKKYKKYFMRFSKWPMVTENESINLVWEKIPLYQPIPAWTLHSQVKSVVPIYIDFVEIKKYFES